MGITSFAGGRRLLLAGFGGLVALMLVAGVDALVVLGQVRSSEAQVRDVYLQQSQSLEAIRTGIYQSAIVIRDYLLAGNPSDIHEDGQKWSEIRSQTDAALDRCGRLLDTGESPVFQELRGEVSGYWQLLQSIVESQTTGAQTRELPREVIRRRAATLDLVNRIDQFSTMQLTSTDAKLSVAFDRLRLRLIVMLAVTVGAGLLLAAFTVRRTLRLESELERRYREGVRARHELQDLSARLVSAQEEERKAISRELHDEVGQSLTALLMEAGNTAASVAADSVEVRRHVESIKKLAEASVQVIRNMALLLRPSMLDDFGLVPALEWQAREVSKRTGLRIQVDALVDSIESAGDLPDAHMTCIYRVVQEALHNCVRHAGAQTVKVQVRQESSRIVLSVEDDGKGFDARRTRGLGLVGMEERVNHLNGVFRIDSIPGGGTKVAVELPLSGAKDSDGRNAVAKEYVYDSDSSRG